MGETERRERDRENGQQTHRQPHQTTHHIRKMDEGGGRLQFIPSSTPNFSFFLASLSACLSFIFWLPNSLFLISHCLSCSICVTSWPSVSFLFFILFLSAFLSNFKFHLTLYQAKKAIYLVFQPCFYSLLPSLTCKNYFYNN